MKIEPVSTTSSKAQDSAPLPLPTALSKIPVNYTLGNDGSGSVVMEFESKMERLDIHKKSKF